MDIYVRNKIHIYTHIKYFCHFFFKFSNALQIVLEIQMQYVLIIQIYK